jgi:hypothetical protein
MKTAVFRIAEANAGLKLRDRSELAEEALSSRRDTTPHNLHIPASDRAPIGSNIPSAETETHRVL